jgi:hypothetical protein
MVQEFTGDRVGGEVRAHLARDDTSYRRYIDAREPLVCTGRRQQNLGLGVTTQLPGNTAREETGVLNHFVEMLKSAARQILCVAMIFFGSLLAANTSVGPCGGTMLAVEPFPAILIAILGLELILCSYFLVKTLKVESDFRVVIYLFLGMWALTLVLSVIMFLRAGSTPAREDLNDLYFSLLRGLAAVANLVLFYRWAGAKKLITRVF